ncbi:hypothetical protein P7B02_17715 [Caulobacter segnis]|nr:hypothetical protein [Caulobacter segnis]MDG2523369.1 hypothetical protein [Caulobacter segnis]
MANQANHALTAGFFIGVAETDEARFEAADGSGVFIYGNDTVALPADD